jgi:CheY-like chemotaxis protein
LPNKKQIILVEKNLFFSTKISANLKQLGYKTVITESLQGVKSKISSETNGIIVSLSLPDKDVLEIIKSLKQNPATASIPLIAYGRHTHRDLFQTARNLGCDVTATNLEITSHLSSLLVKAKFDIE